MIYTVKRNQVRTILIPLEKVEEVEVVLEEEGATAYILAYFVGLGNANVETRLTITHRAPQTTAEAKVRRVLSENSYCRFAGLIRIDQKASLTNSYLADDTLILSQRARAESAPSLEIKANAVRASHGATLGKINANELFYLMSRGLSEKEARQLIVKGFLQPILTRMASSERKRKDLLAKIRKL